MEEAPFLLGQVYRWLERLEVWNRLPDYERYACNKYGAPSLEQLSKEQLIEQIAILRQCGESNERREQLIDI